MSILISQLLYFQALALLAEYIDKEDSSVRIGAIMGLGLAYAGAQNEQVRFLAFLSGRYSVRHANCLCSWASLFFIGMHFIGMNQLIRPTAM